MSDRAAHKTRTKLENCNRTQLHFLQEGGTHSVHLYLSERECPSPYNDQCVYCMLFLSGAAWTLQTVVDKGQGFLQCRSAT